MYYWYSFCWRLYHSCIRLVIVGYFKHIYQESHGHKDAKQDSGQQNNFGDNSRSNTFDPTKLKKIPLHEDLSEYNVIDTGKALFFQFSVIVQQAKIVC